MSLALGMTSCYVFKDAKLLTDSMTVCLGFASKESRAPKERAEERVSRAGPETAEAGEAPCGSARCSRHCC